MEFNLNHVYEYLLSLYISILQMVVNNNIANQKFKSWLQRVY